MQVLEFGANIDQQYISIVKPKLLTRNFLSKYIDKQPPFGQLGLIVYLRTYSRFIPQLKRREKWWETCLRVVEYSFSLLPDKPRKPSYFTQEKQKEEAEALFDTLFNLRGFTSGRTLFVGGSEASRLYPSSNFNCSYCNVDSLKSFADAMYLLLLGCGVGYSVESKHVSKLPQFNRDISVQFEPYAAKPKIFRKESTEVIGNSNFNYEITVGDSKEGWVEALRQFLSLHSNPETKTITLNFDSVRPEGERLKTFGGRASGYIPLQTMFEEIHDRIISTKNGVIDSVTAMDIMNSIAKAIVVGGVRRCLPKGTLVHTSKGLTPIEQIKSGDLVKSGETYYPVLNQWSTGNKTQLKINTILGEFSCSPEHRVAVLTSLEGRLSWKAAKDLSLEDRLVFNYGGVEGSQTELPSFEFTKSDKDYTSNSFRVPELTSNVSWLLGYLHGNGSVNIFDRNTTDSSSYVSFACPDNLPKCSSKVISVLEEDFKVKVSPYNTLNEGCSKPRVTSIQFATYMSKFKQSNTPLEIPECVLQGTRGVRIAYLAGLFDADGYMQQTKSKTAPIEIVSTIYKDFAYQVTYLLSSLGIASKFVEGKSYPSRKTNWQPLHKVQLLGDRDIKEFAQNFIKDSVKLESRVQLIQERTKSQYSFSATPEIVKNSISKSNFDSSYSCTINLGWQKAENVLGSRWFAPVPILAIAEDGASEMYDIEVQDSHSFVVGNGLLVHNSSQISFGDLDDNNFRDAKKDLWSDPTKSKYSTTRVLSNNSVHLWGKPTFEKLTELFQTIRNNGEPALYIAENASKHREEYFGSNPCGEILLANQGVCNLTTQNLFSFVDEFGNFLFDAAIESVKLLTRVGSRITLVDMWDKDWDYIQKRDRLLGVSLTGIVEAYNALNDTEKLNWEYYITELRKAARDEADLYHDALGIPRSYLVTTLKPEGTLSQLPTVSSGVHAPYAPYYTRRIRISKRDPIANALLDLGLVPVPENGQGDDIHADECNTWVFSFSVKTKAQIRSIDESAIEQLERYKFFMKNWAEHNVSVTITVAENEWDGVVNWVWENWEYCIGIAFLPRFDPAELDSPYPNMPYESSTESDYKSLEILESQLVSLISKYETEYEEYELDASCGGLTACPVR